MNKKKNFYLKVFLSVHFQTYHYGLKRVLDDVKHFYVGILEHYEKLDALINILDHAQRPKSVIYITVFNINTISWLKYKLKKEGFTVSSITQRTQKIEFDKALSNFKNGVINILISTDIDAPNIDMQGVKIIFNWNKPKINEHYVNRITGSGKSKLSGLVINMCNRAEYLNCEKLESIYNITIRYLPRNFNTLYIPNIENTN